MGAPQRVDYERIEPGWRAGLKSPAQLAAEHEKDTGQKVSRSAIIQHFGRLGVPRNLNAKIQAKADALVSQSIVTGKLSTATLASETTVIAGGAMIVATIKVEHRGLAKRLRDVLDGIITDLETTEDDLKTRVNCAKQATDTLASIIKIEADSYGFANVIEAPEKPEEFDPIEGARRIAFILAKADHAIRQSETLQ